MKSPLGIAAAILAVILLIPTSAQARHHHYNHRHQHYRIQTDATPSYAYGQEQYRVAYANYERQMRQYRAEVGHVVGGRPSGCPHAFCGCAVSLHVFGRIIPSLNLASNWNMFQPAAPAPGMVAVRNGGGHVFVIQSVDGNGNVMAWDPNSGGHATRVHLASLRGYHVVNPHSTRMARI